MEAKIIKFLVIEPGDIGDCLDIVYLTDEVCDIIIATGMEKAQQDAIINSKGEEDISYRKGKVAWIEDSWIDVPVPADGISTFVHYKCYGVVVRIYSQDIVDGFINLDDPFGLKEKDNA